ncbi:tetratricopeptide repeat protein [Nonomuraea aurantiaca]|uniref:tetratricopeptide repeat protein n=1 Tax=Nonomuraea aurantiaca TaxID=2878562 RepID=UPI001CD95569|nr:tetratricopeptide repeat protein [Nonomuraea aurantiaca]MCA2220018.1 tetratricopeptide repeat protein [Nonomuraea aurantiaca]
MGRGAPRHPRLTGVLTEVSARTGARFVEAAVTVATRLEDPRPLVGVLREAVNENGDQAVNLVLAQIPDTTLALAELAVLANERALEAHLLLPDRDPAVTAHLLNRLARRLRQLGKPHDGLIAIRQSFDLYRRLAETDQETYLTHCMSALHIASLCLSDLGEAEAAADHAERAVIGYRGLMAARPDAYASELANSLNTLSNRYRALSRHREAVDTATEATQLYIGLWDSGHETTVMHDLARSLNNLAVHLRATGDHAAALEIVLDAIDLRRRLADHQPDAYLPDLASTLNTKALLLEDIDRKEEAAEAAAETIEIYRRLAMHRPEVFLSDLAMALNNGAIISAPVGLTAESLAMAEESATLYRELAIRDPGVFTQDLAMAFNTKALALGRLGRTEEALETINASVEIRRSLLPTEDREILSGLGAALANLGVRLRSMNRFEEAAANSEESVAVFRELAAQEDGYRSRLANALNGLALARASLGLTAESAAAAGEAVAVYRAIREDQPSLCRRDLAAALTNLAAAVNGEEPERALGLLEEALQLCDPVTDAALSGEILDSIAALRQSGPDDPADTVNR